MDQTRILLWSPTGASPHFYSGPGIVTYRLYKNRDPKTVSVELAHGSAAQPAHPELFAAQHLIWPFFAVPRPGAAESGSVAGDRKFEPPPLLRAMRRAMFALRSRQWVGRNAGRFDVFHGLGLLSTTVTAGLRAEEKGLPTVLTSIIEGELTHGSALATRTGMFRRRLASLRRARALVAISDRIRERLLAIGLPAEKVVQLPVCGVDIDLFRPLANHGARADLRRDLRLADRPMCLFAGQVAPRKRPHLLVGALAELKRRGIDGQVVLAGPTHDQDYADQMRRESEALGVADRIVWYGFTEKIQALMQVADTLALPSTDEGLPGVIMEAMACGVPCVYTDISGARDLIDDGADGRIVGADGSGLADALATYLAEPEASRTQGERAREKVASRFSSRAVWQAYLRVFENVRAGRPPGA
jgi:glycosyltransferase involved in cell wall biosynthesis